MEQKLLEKRKHKMRQQDKTKGGGKVRGVGDRKVQSYTIYTWLLLESTKQV